MGEAVGGVIELGYLTDGEYRRVRPFVRVLGQKKPFKLPGDDDTIHKMQEDYLDIIDYIFKRCSGSGYAEKVMIEEMHNIALVIKGYCSKHEMDVWEEKWHDYHIRMFNHILKKGLKYNKAIIAKLLVESELPDILSMCISQVDPSYESDISLISEYLNDSAISEINKHMLCFMTSRVIKAVKKEAVINIERLNEDELITAIKVQYYDGDDKVKVNRRLVRLISNMQGNCDLKDKYDHIVKDVINLHIGNMLPITMYSGLIEYHILYRLLYHPGDIDYTSIDLNAFVNAKSRKIIDNAIKYGKYVLYKRVRDEFRKDMGIKFCEAFKQILSNEQYKYLYDLELENRKKRIVRRRYKNSANNNKGV